MKKRSKLIFYVLLFVFGVIGISLTSNAANDGKNYIYTRAQLEALDGKSGTYYLANDIDLGGKAWTPISFSGKLYGKGYAIENMSFNKSAKLDYCGLFEELKNATIHSLHLKNVSATADNVRLDKVGALCGYAENSHFIGCVTSGVMKYTAIYGISGSIGGLVGDSYQCEFKQCLNSMKVDVLCELLANNDYAYIGGIVGTLGGKDAILKNSYNEGEVTLNTTKGKDTKAYLAGLVGLNYGSVSYCYNRGVTSTPGEINWSNVAINKNYMYCVYAINDEKYGQRYWPGDDTLVSPKEIDNKKLFVGFDFENIWNISEKGPVLMFYEKRTDAPEISEIKDNKTGEVKITLSVNDGNPDTKIYYVINPKDDVTITNNTSKNGVKEYTKPFVITKEGKTVIKVRALAPGRNYSKTVKHTVTVSYDDASDSGKDDVSNPSKDDASDSGKDDASTPGKDDASNPGKDDASNSEDDDYKKPANKAPQKTEKVKVPKTTNVKVSKSKKKSKKVTITWKKKNNVTGYAIFVKEKKSGKYRCIGVIYGANTTKFVTTSLKKGKKYTIGVKCFKEKGNKKYWGKMSKTVSIKL